MMGKVISKGLGAITKPLGKLTGGLTDIVPGILDKYTGTDIGGFKAAQAEAQRQEDARNQAALNSQLNANILGGQGTDNIVQVEAGGSAADAATTGGNRRKRTGTISTTLGI